MVENRVYKINKAPDDTDWCEGVRERMKQGETKNDANFQPELPSTLLPWSDTVKPRHRPDGSISHDFGW